MIAQSTWSYRGSDECTTYAVTMDAMNVPANAYVVIAPKLLKKCF